MRMKGAVMENFTRGWRPVIIGALAMLGVSLAYFVLQPEFQLVRSETTFVND